MNAGFFKRALSTLIDALLVVAVVYLSFLVLGRTILQNQVDHFDELYGAYEEISDAYYAELGILSDQYNASVELANGDETLKNLAYDTYVADKAVLDTQYSIDIEPYNVPISLYFWTCILYFVIGFIVILSIYTVVLTGKTLGRKIFQVKLDGPSVNPLSVFFHDIVFKFLFVVLTVMISPYIGVAVLLLTLMIDLIMISMTPKKTTLRDRLLKMSVVKTGYGY
ncbi:MAG TPA: RDD family protein [Candidatus Izemoplasmatales bacterium]|nr:RDD family protein [Bacillota bacterium]HRY77878.1 RDD family protein [Candidatus Izemoplasmatales bacterium]